MKIMLRCISRLELTMTGSCFPIFESMLGKRFLGGLKKFLIKTGNPITDPIDVLFITIFPEFEESCFKFYDEDGPSLTEIESEESIKSMEKIMLTLVDKIKSIEVKKLQLK